MDSLVVPLKLLLSLLIGAAIGFERESYEKIHFSKTNKSKTGSKGALGVRTFALITTLGTLAGLMRQDYFELFLLISIVFLIMVVAYYITGSIFLKDNGMTTELAIIFSYLIGVFIALDVFSAQVILAITVVLILILSQKDRVREIILGISQKEITAFISYAIIALVILPFLPNYNFTLNNFPKLVELLESFGASTEILSQIIIINPYKLWLVVALITGIQIVGYILAKTLGQKKGWLITSLVGGFVSSTAVTQTLAQQSRITKTRPNQLVAALILACMASFFQLIILIAVINIPFLIASAFTFIALILSAALTSYIFLKTDSDKKIQNLSETKKHLQEIQIISLIPALKFALLFFFISLFVNTALVVFGQRAFLITSSVAALTGLDAVVINLSALVGKTLTYQVGVITLIIINAVNLLGKFAYSYWQGKREFALKFGLAAIFMVVISLSGLLIF